MQKRLARGDEPINALDKACKIHDVAYAESKDLESRRLADLDLGRAADERVRSKNASLGERLTATVVKTVMAAKRRLGGGLRRRQVRRKRRATPRVLLTPRFGAGYRGGFIVPAAAAVTAGLGAYKTFRDMRNAKRVLEERERHHRTLEKIASE